MCTTACAPVLTAEPDALDVAGQQFADKLIGMINAGSAGFMVSIGHRTGLFEAMKGAGALSSAELAGRARLNERYVREWLAAMAAAGIVTIERGTRRYALPEAHADLLGRGAAKGSMSNMFQFLSVLGSVESRIVDCFKKGGGVPYSAFDRFHEVMAEESDQTVVAALESAILPLVPGLIARLEAGIDVADIGCGVGRALNRMAQLYPNSRFSGFDLSAEAVTLAQLDAHRLGLSNVTFDAVDATKLSGGAQFDLICTFDAVHDQAHPAVVLSHIRRLLRPDGVYLMQDIDSVSEVEDNLANPIAPYLYTISCMHCMTVSLAQGGVGLGTAWGEQLALAMLADAGFGRVETHRLPHDFVNLFYICRP